MKKSSVPSALETACLPARLTKRPPTSYLIDASLPPKSGGGKLRGACPAGEERLFSGTASTDTSVSLSLPPWWGKGRAPKDFFGQQLRRRQGKDELPKWGGGLKRDKQEEGPKKEMGKTNVRNWKLRCVGGGKKKKSNARRMNSLQRAPKPLN